MTKDLDFSGKVVLVTGGSRGIGRAACIKFGQLGAKVAVNYASNQEAADATVEAIKAAGGEAIGVHGDVSNTQQVQTMVKRIIDTYSQIDVLVNNAGGGRGGTIMDMTEEEWDGVVDVNLKGTFLMTREVLKYMIPRRQGRIINVSSLAGRTGTTPTNYAAAKAGLFGFTRALARDIAPYNILTSCLCPGLTDTDAVKRMAPERRAEKVADTLLGRIGEPEEVGDVIVFLASPMSRFITGSILDVNGGRTGG